MTLKELRGKRDALIEETGDQGRQPESQKDTNHWIQDAFPKHGTPDWYNSAFGTSNLAVPADK